MAQYKVQIGGGNWLTNQGGLVGTATDLDTGVIELFNLGCGRSSIKKGVNKNGLFYDVKTNEPSIAYDGGKSYLRCEKSSTNLLTKSNSLNDAKWQKSGLVTVEEAAAYSPSGKKDAWKVSNATGTGVSANTLSIGTSGLTSSEEYSSVLYVKSAGATTCKMIMRDGNTGVTEEVVVDLTDGKWHGEPITQTLGASSTIFQFALGETDGDVYVWNVQMEQGDVVTSPIVTDASTVTRLADTGLATPNISRFINSKEFVMVVKAKTQNISQTRNISLSDGTSNNRLNFQFGNNALGRVDSQLIVGGVAQDQFFKTGLDLSDDHTYVSSVSDLGFKYYVDGVKVNEDLSISKLNEGDLKYIKMSSVTNIYQFEGDVEEITIYPSIEAAINDGYTYL